ncbi:MAG: histone deacetylase family protein [Gammaproteobacteria bacterium]
MKIFYSPAHERQHGASELTGGRLVPAYDCPERMESILAELTRRGMDDIQAVRDGGLAPVLAVHEPRYVAFLQEAWDQWVAAHGGEVCALPLSWRAPGMRGDREPEHIDGRLGFWSFDAGTPITAGTWEAARAAAAVADSARRAVSSGQAAAFALSRPPGHHAGRSFFGGYCFINNAAVAAQGFRDAGVPSVAVLDVDYHHGNGTQEIFSGREDVLTVSVHCDPRQAFPFFLGHGDETEGGTHLNLPLPKGTDWRGYEPALETALARIADFSPEALVVSLGVDTWEGDPISGFRLTTADFRRMGRRIGSGAPPTVIVMEGGYGLEAIGANVAGFLEGFAEG